MKLYDAAWAPSPRRVRIFLAEKGVEVARVAIDLRQDEQLGAAYRAVVPRGVVPALVLDDGAVVTESAAICRYFEALHPDPPLFGADAIEIARVEEWTRRTEDSGYVAAVEGLRNVNPAFVDRALPGAGPAIAQIPALADRARARWAGFVAMLDAQLAEREWVVGARYTFADIVALVTVDFARAAKLAVPEEAMHLRRWHAAASARPSARA